jgi:hypothetical protein
MQNQAQQKFVEINLGLAFQASKNRFFRAIIASRATSLSVDLDFLSSQLVLKSIKILSPNFQKINLFII